MSEENEYKLLFDEHVGSLRRFVYFKVGNEEVANDIVQDAFLKIWEKRSTVKWETAAGLLYTAANNLAMNHLNHQKVRLRFTQAGHNDRDEQNPHYLMEAEEFKSKLQNCLNQLPDPSREAFLLNRIDKKKYQQIAEALTISVKAVEKRMSIAIKLLTQCVGYKL